MIIELIVGYTLGYTLGEVYDFYQCIKREKYIKEYQDGMLRGRIYLNKQLFNMVDETKKELQELKNKKKV